MLRAVAARFAVATKTYIKTTGTSALSTILAYRTSSLRPATQRRRGCVETPPRPHHRTGRKLPHRRLKPAHQPQRQSHKGDVRRTTKSADFICRQIRSTKICRVSCKNRPISSADKIARCCRPILSAKIEADVRRTTKSADFCGRGLIAQQNRPTKPMNHDTRPIVLSATCICCPIYKKSADKIVEDRTCSILADKIGRYCQPTKLGDFCVTHDRFLSGDFVGR